MRISYWSSDVCSSDLIPPIAWATRLTAGAQNAFIEAVKLRPVFRRLQALLARRRRRHGLDPRLNRTVLCIEMREVGDEILDDVHMRQRRDPHIAFAVFNRGRA